MHPRQTQRMVLALALALCALLLLATPRSALAGEGETGPLADDALRRSDPKGYELVLKNRARIESELKQQRTGVRMVSAGVQALGASAYSPYGYLSFRLVPGSGDWTYNGYRGTLYFTYGIYNATVDAYKWFTVSWPAISGSNRPADQSKSSYGPIPEYTWDYGFMSGSWRGYEPDTRAEFYPGQWRLDPWSGGPYGRCYLEVHGGNGTHYFKPTHGCIRITPSNIGSLKSYYDTKMANKKDRSAAHLFVDY